LGGLGHVVPGLYLGAYGGQRRLGRGGVPHPRFHAQNLQGAWIPGLDRPDKIRIGLGRGRQSEAFENVLAFLFLFSPAFYHFSLNSSSAYGLSIRKGKNRI
jgi:hypothetical protein